MRTPTIDERADAEVAAIKATPLRYECVNVFPDGTPGCWLERYAIVHGLESWSGFADWACIRDQLQSLGVHSAGDLVERVWHANDNACLNTDPALDRTLKSIAESAMRALVFTRLTAEAASR